MLHLTVVPGVLTVLALISFAYLALVGATYTLQRSLLYLPDGHQTTPHASGLADMEVVTLQTADGLSLVSWYSAAVGDRVTIVHFHGNGGNIATRASRMRPYLTSGLGLLMVEYRGYGGNPGTPTEQGFYQDARAALAFLASRGVPSEKAVMYGESLGSGVAVQIAAEQARDAARKPVAAVVLEAPLSSVTDVAAYHYPFLPVRWLLKDRYDSVDKITFVEAPILIVHGARDTVVPIRFGRKLYAAAQEPKEAHWIPRGEHENLDKFGLQSTVIAFLDRRMQAQ